jgi:zinc transport system permease protein
MEPFLIRALAAGVGLALVAAPLGCFVVWNRMAYFGETIAQASLIGVALGLLFKLDLTLTTLAVTLAVAGLLIALGKQKLIPLDSLLALLAHGALAVGVIATSLVKGPSVDLMGYLFGDIFAVSNSDLMWVFGGGTIVLAVLWAYWHRLLAVAVHEDLAAAEGIARERVRAVLVILLSLTIAVAMKIVGILLVIAFLIMPAAASRPHVRTPEAMAAGAAAVGVGGVVAGMWLSYRADIPGGASIVLVLAIFAGLSLALGGRRVAR